MAYLSTKTPSARSDLSVLADEEVKWMRVCPRLSLQNVDCPQREIVHDFQMLICELLLKNEQLRRKLADATLSGGNPTISR